MIFHRKIIRFPWLTHRIAQVNAVSVRLMNRFGNFRNDQIRQDAGENTADPVNNQIRFLDRMDSLFRALTGS